MKILQMAPEYPPYSIGGGGVVIQNISENMKRGNDVTVMSGYYDTKSFFDNIKIENKNGVAITWLPLVPMPKVDFQLKTIMPPNFHSMIYLFNQIRNNDFDIVHLHGYGHFLIDYASILCWIFKKRNILTIHGFPTTPEKRGGILKIIYDVYSKTLGRFVLKHVTKITIVSKSLEEDLVNRHKIDKSRISIIPNGVDLSIYKNIKENKFRKNYRISKDSLLILSIGRLSWMKGFQYLIRAMPEILKQRPDAILVIIGNDGGYETELKSLVRTLRLDDNVLLLGFIDNPMKGCAIKDADIFVIPSTIEAFGLISLEAMAVGKPIVSTNVGGLKDILRDNESALLVNPEDSSELSDAIKRLMADKNICNNLASNAAKDVEKYEWKNISKCYIDLFKEI
jgi:glycosyltransferase involved in cell wall biosynthesis